MMNQDGMVFKLETITANLDLSDSSYSGSRNRFVLAPLCENPLVVSTQC
jgi:hypothetical protein